MTTFHHASGNTRGVDGRVICGNEEKANKETRFVGTTDIINLVVSRKNGLEYQAFPFTKTFLAQCLAILYRLHDGLVRVPVTELIIGYLVWVDIYSVLHPLMLQYLSSDGCLARTIWSGNNNKNGFVNSGYHVAEIFCASSRICSKKRAVASSFVRLASSAASFINCERTASEGSSILVNRYVSIVGFITMMFLLSAAKLQKVEHKTKKLVLFLSRRGKFATFVAKLQKVEHKTKKLVHFLSRRVCKWPGESDLCNCTYDACCFLSRLLWQ